MDDQTSLLSNATRQKGDPVACLVFNRLKNAVNSDNSDRPYMIEFSNLTSQSMEVREILKEYFDTNSKLPLWANHQLIHEGSSLFGLYGPQIVISLFCHALPACYSCANGAEVLVKTGKLVHGTKPGYPVFTSRIMETAQFVINVMKPDALFDGSACRSILQIRLIHEAIRNYIQSSDWDSEAFGMPINQQDMVGTLMSFSYISLVSLEKMGVVLTAKQKHACIHLWAVIGYILGIDEQYIPQTFNDAKIATHKILADQAAESEAGKILTASLLDFIDKILLEDDFDDFAPFMIRYMSGNRYANMLGVPPAKQWLMKFVVPIIHVFMHSYERFLKRNNWMKNLIGFWSMKFLQRLICHYSKEKEVEFAIPARLKAHWESKEIQSKRSKIRSN